MKKVNPITERIPLIDRIRTAYIMYKDIPVATITEEFSTISGDSDWVIRPMYDNIKKVKEKYNHTIDIAGINLDLHKEEYVRNVLPAFVEQRTLPECRPDLREMLDMVRMNYYDRFEFMCRYHGVCGNDQLYVSRTPDKIIDVTNYPWEFDIPETDENKF